jgi:hypothetical protein
LIYNQIFKLAIALSRWRDHTELENVNGRARRRVFSRNKPFAFFAPRPPNRIRISGWRGTHRDCSQTSGDPAVLEALG